MCYQEELYLKRVSELDQITDMRDQQRRLHEDLRKQRLDEFMSGFSVITSKLKEMYQMITLGGDAELELVDSLDPFSEGIVFRWEIHWFLDFQIYWNQVVESRLYLVLKKDFQMVEKM